MNKIKIGGMPYVIQPIERTDETKSAWCDVEKCVIHIDREMHPEQQRSALIHEVLEAVNNMYDIGLKHRQIMQLEAALHQIVVDNFS